MGSEWLEKRKARFVIVTKLTRPIQRKLTSLRETGMSEKDNTKARRLLILISPHMESFNPVCHKHKVPSPPVCYQLPIDENKLPHAGHFECLICHVPRNKDD